MKIRDKLRTQGGLFVRPFKDKNNNGQLDKGEEIYSDDLELLVIINNKPVTVPEGYIQIGI